MANTPKTKDKLRRIFIDAQGEPHARATLDATTVVYKYQDDSETRFDLATIFPSGLPAPCVGRAAAAFGVNVSAGNLVGSAAFDTVDKIKEAIESRLEAFAAGSWSTAREAGDRPSMLLDAWAAFRTKNGATANDDWRKQAIEKLKDEDFREELVKEPQVAAELANLRAQAAAERAQRAAEAAKGSGPSAALLG